MFVDRHDDDDADDRGVDATDGDGGDGDGGGDGGDGGDTKRCPSCGDAFIPTAKRCPSCEVELVDGDEPVVYTFLTGDAAAVEALERLMHESMVPHQLVDDELIVPGTHAVAAERVLDLLDEALGVAIGHGAPVEPIELWDWEDHGLDLLEAELRVARVPHSWDDEGSLLVPPDHLAEAEVVIDRVAHPDALDPDTDPGPVGSPELMSDLFLAAGAVRKEPWNLQSVAELRTCAEKAAASVPPFGVDPNTWRLAFEAATDAVVASGDGDGDEAEVKAAADRVYTVLRPLV